MKMKKKLLLQCLLAALLLPVFPSCSDDDDVPGVNTLNMLNVNNGATRLGNSDIYIDAANNFQTNECLIAGIGPSEGLDKVVPPQVGAGLVRQVAVVPGQLYQAFREEAVRQFPSGAFALATAGDYYQFYVDSEILKEEEQIGAVVRFALIAPEENGLPDYGSTIGTVRAYTDDEVTYRFPKGTELDYDEEELGDCFTIEFDGSTLRLRHNGQGDTGKLSLHARNGALYTQVYVEIVE